MGKRYRQEVEGEDGWSRWVQPAPDYRMMCCDCDLVHVVQFRMHDGFIQFRANRHVRATASTRAARRRAERIKNATDAPR